MPTPTGVTVGTPVNLGPVTAVSLTGTDVDAVNGWLADNGFVIPDDRLDLLDSYVGYGRYFIAVKRNDAIADGGPTSIGLHYSLAGDYRQLSLAFARLGAAPTVAFTVFVATPGGYPIPSAPWKYVTLDDLSSLMLRFGAYTDAVKTAVANSGSRAFVWESTRADPAHLMGAAGGPGFQGAAGAGGASSAKSPLLALFDRDQLLSRFSTVLDADALTEDASFYDTGDPHGLGSRTVLRARLPVVRYASIGWVVALGAGGALRRRGRARQRAARRA
jgi:hypothetical protein